MVGLEKWEKDLNIRDPRPRFYDIWDDDAFGSMGLGGAPTVPVVRACLSRNKGFLALLLRYLAGMRLSPF